MSNSGRKQTNCVICNSGNLQKKNEWHTYCSRCGHIWQSSGISSFDYDDAYIAAYEKYPNDVMGAVRGNHLISATHPSKSDNILDFGCGIGSTTKYLNSIGYRKAVGYDVNNYPSPIEKIPYEDVLSTSWYAVTAYDVIEHIENPIDVIGKISTKYWVVSVPNAEDPFLHDHFEEWRHYKPSEHLHYFTSKSIQMLFLSAGYVLLEHVFVEDFVRKPQPGVTRNIATYTFGLIGH